MRQPYAGFPRQRRALEKGTMLEPRGKTECVSLSWLRNLHHGRGQALVEDQLNFLMLPDSPLHVERRFDLRRRPAIAAAFDVVRIMKIHNPLPGRRKPHGE